MWKYIGFFFITSLWTQRPIEHKLHLKKKVSDVNCLKRVHYWCTDVEIEIKKKYHFIGKMHNMQGFLEFMDI